MKAWSVWVPADEVGGIIAAKTRGAAKAGVVRQANEVGYETSFADKMHIVRAPEFDEWAAEHTRTSGLVSAEYITTTETNGQG